MYQDVVELRRFYETPLGRITARLVRRQITALWPDMTGMDLLGLGYSVPYLDVFRARARHIACIMPAPQGVTAWPRQNRDNGNHHYRGNLTALAHDGNLPVGEAAFDRILMVHTLEHTGHSRSLLREVWRSLAPGGRVIVAVPNRVGFWARTDRTPFGHGTPFSSPQITHLLEDNMLTPTRYKTALHLPPFKRRILLSLLANMDSTSQKWFGKFAGVLLIEAEKQIYATGPRVKRGKHAPRPAIASNSHMQQNKSSKERT